jgi:hypothetical protein
MEAHRSLTQVDFTDALSVAWNATFAVLEFANESSQSES